MTLHAKHVLLHFINATISGIRVIGMNFEEVFVHSFALQQHYDAPAADKLQPEHF